MKKGEIMSKQIFFFLLPEDIKNVLKNIHEKYDLQYLRTGSFTEDEIKKKKYITKPMYSRTLLYSIVNVTVEICYDTYRGVFK